ncbi:HpcH/HpaI aldolase/citrate lyase family protein [Chelativorans sp. YIM 93263]|uniref:HpcH/HpaI aldolase/citrate lyase family protein n=1 Tax=Chelativorans sp. YIM 93263 TaxID=2906648 RepID=UPI0023785E71|nr:CoA ester lyase [Chelativorans sp. YIM 93263]
MRSLLFVPADSERKLEKALSSGADILLLDLEDSVAPGRKEEARRIAADFIAEHKGSSPTLLYVRVNALSTSLTDDDLEAVMPASPDGIMIPKSSGGQDVTLLSVKLRVHEAENGLEDGGTRILPIITETAGAVFATGTYAGASERLSGLTWGAEDLSAEIGARTTRDEVGNLTEPFRLARSITLFAASHAHVPAVDTVFPNFRDEPGFEKECIEAERDGFTAKMAIHPAQVPIINAAFTPSKEAVEESHRVIAAFQEAGETGVASVDGQMVDRPHLRRAERILARARLAGLD